MRRALWSWNFEVRTNKLFKEFQAEGFETLLFYTECFAFRSLARIDLLLNPNISVMSVSLHNLCKEHLSVFNRYAEPCCFY
jgi:hypothetical protein